MRVDVYWNLHRKCWSIRHKGRVIRHAKFVMLEGVTFVVQEAGRQRVLRERKKNVHAFARGRLCYALDHVASVEDPRFQPVTYNPFKAGHFVKRDTDEPVLGAHHAALYDRQVRAALCHAAE